MLRTICYVGAEITSVGVSLGSFSLSAAMLVALNTEFAPEVTAKEGGCISLAYTNSRQCIIFVLQFEYVYVSCTGLYMSYVLIYRRYRCR